MFSGSEVINRIKDVSIREVDGEGILLNETNGSLHILNNTSLYVWKLLDGKTDLNGLAGKVADHFGIDMNEAHDDILTLADTLSGLSLVVIENGV